MNTEMEEIAARLRSIRLSRNLTLADVETKSHKQLRAVALGSYERGDRTLSVKKAAQLSEFYDVPLSYLLTGRSPTQKADCEIAIDLRRIKGSASQKRRARQQHRFFSHLSLALSKSARILTGKFYPCARVILHF